ncbi:uncharacterized protein LOC114518711 [Rhizophagus clarus]|uniref:Uncharacterized protein LOC114518711 n=1 Tax=Rhizophagus clarus TaxID=94130 RepID=A0A8H3M286_9GLOM|nr:uncharacterized protein LOC114518711 [Rhizophagus clarus]
MNSGEVPDKLQNLTKIEKILITQVFPVMSVYRLCGDVLIIHYQFMNNLESFRDFRVYWLKVVRVQLWLKKNNHYYSNITIDHEALQSLPIDGLIDNKLQDIAEESNFKNEDDMIIHFFVLILPPSDHENVAIQNSLNQMQKNYPII